MRNGKPHHHKHFKHEKRGNNPRDKKVLKPLPIAQGMDETKGGSHWLYGFHALESALQNPTRKFRRLIHTGSKTKPDTFERSDLPAWELVSAQEIHALLPKDAVHQGIAALTDPLDEPELEAICQTLAEKKNGLLLLLDQVTDPHNVGAIMRSSAAFGADAVILTERHAAPQSGVLAKAASGALDVIPLCRVTNLARAIEMIKEAGFWCVGLAGEAEKELGEIDLKGKIALILGSEESGLRRLTRENSDFLARLPTQGSIDQLNVSNAAAIALYEVKRQQAPR